MAEDKTQSKKPVAPNASKPMPSGRPVFGKPQASNVNVDKYGPDFRHIIRIVNTDLKGEKKVLMAYRRSRV